MLDIDIHGVRQMKRQKDLDVRYVFLKPESLEKLEGRLRGRGTESERDVRERLERAEGEIEFADTPGMFDWVVFNDELERAYGELKD